MKTPPSVFTKRVEISYCQLQTIGGCISSIRYQMNFEGKLCCSISSQGKVGGRRWVTNLWHCTFYLQIKVGCEFFFSATHHICESNNVSRIYHHFAWRQLKWNPTLKRNLATSTDIQATNKALESAVTFPKLVSQYRDKLTVWTTKHKNIGVKERGDKMVVNSSSAGRLTKWRKFGRCERI